MTQISFDSLKPTYKITKPIRLIELFAGIGAQAKALENLGVDFEHYRICEFDKFAVQSYNAIHGTDFTTSDITALRGVDLGIVDTDKYCYIMTYSFPCQDLSICGKQKGMSKGENTRSGLLWEVERLLNEVDNSPDILLMENVIQVHSEKNRADFIKWISFLENKGYSNYYADLNAKNYGVAQNRNRCFMISILGAYNYEFPQPVQLDKTMGDYLEPTVDEKYILSLKGAKYVTNPKRDRRDRFIKINPQIGCAIMARANSNWNGNFVTCNLAGNLCGGKWERVLDSCRRVYLQSGISPTVTTQQGGNQDIKIEVNQGPLKLRKLTPRECFRLMSFSDEDIDKCYAIGMSDSQLYKQAGNSIVVRVLEKIFEKLI